MKLLIKNGHVFDPSTKMDGIFDILVEGKTISQIKEDIRVKADMTIDASGKKVIPGIIDLHVHLRQPGREDKETIFSGTRAAAAGGVTSVVAMPNTEPALDSTGTLKTLSEIIKQDALINVFSCGAITKGRAGVDLTDFSALKSCGVVALSDDGASVDADEVMKSAFSQAVNNNMLLMCHCEDTHLSAGGCVNHGFTSTRMGLRGVSKESEFKRIARDIELARQTNSRIHIMHVSCAESVDIIEKAKKSGVLVTAETAPHYFALNEEMVLEYDANFKMNPPLRGKEDFIRIREGLAQGIIDCIASDHAPHTENEKEIEFERAAFGVVGLETILSVSIAELIIPKILTWHQLIEKLSFNPARILGLPKGSIVQGADADIAIISSDAMWTVGKETLFSKSKNSPFLGKNLPGMVDYTICAGCVVFNRKTGFSESRL